MRFLLVLFPFLVACQDFSDNSLLGEMEQTSNCPAGGCINNEPTVSDLFITSTGRATVYSQVTTTSALHIGGDCFASTYPNNKILLTAYVGNNAVTTGHISASVDGAVKCNKGRYDVVMDVGPFAVGTYRIRMDIVGIDSKNAEFRNSSAFFEFNLSRF